MLRGHRVSAQPETFRVQSLVPDHPCFHVRQQVRTAILVDLQQYTTLARLDRHKSLIMRLARLEKAEPTDSVPQGAVQMVLNEATIFLPLADVIDLDAEMERLKKAIAKLEGEVKKIDAKLGNEKFLAGAPEHVVEEQRERKVDAESTISRLSDAVKRLESAA